MTPGWTKTAETCPTTQRSTVQKTRSLWNPSLHQLFIFTAGQLVAPPGTNAVKIEEMTVKPGGQLNKQDSRVCLTATLWSLEDARPPLTESTCLMIRTGVKRHFIMSRRSQPRNIERWIWFLSWELDTFYIYRTCNFDDVDYDRYVLYDEVSVCVFVCHKKWSLPIHPSWAPAVGRLWPSDDDDNHQNDDNDGSNVDDEGLHLTSQLRDVSLSASRSVSWRTTFVGNAWSVHSSEHPLCTYS